MMAAVLIAMLLIAGAAATGAIGQTYPGPSQRIEPQQPMQSMQPMQPMAPLPAPPMRAPGDTPGSQTTVPQAGSSGSSAGSSPMMAQPPVSGSDMQPPADSQSPR
ncbi:MAG TPA: hypothetical protein VL966_13165 [Alphaproteobacteria bacterium]|jgi:hypothetical protein|nr:hypothetical protein [Alphaproteobacteria bacterium]